jgi:hypothetical protein
MIRMSRLTWLLRDAAHRPARFGRRHVLHHCIGHVAQTHASLEVMIRQIWIYFLPTDKKHRTLQAPGTGNLVEDIRRGLEDAELPPAVLAAANEVLQRVKAATELRNRVVHDYCPETHPPDPEIPSASAEPRRRAPWERLDVRAPIGTIHVVPSDLGDVKACLVALQARSADIGDLLMLLWHHVPIMASGTPSRSVHELLNSIALHGRGPSASACGPPG